MTRRYVCRVYVTVFAVALAWGFAVSALRAAESDDMMRIRAKYHIIYTDMPREMIYEAIARLNAMAEQYHHRTKGFGGKITRRLKFYMYSNYDDYLKFVGRKFRGSVGIYNPNTKTLRAAVDTSKFIDNQIWHTIQHEGWHQFANMVVCRDRHQLPVWLDESLAEYFGEAIWTGDRLVCGVIDVEGHQKKTGDKIYVIPPRMGRIQKSIHDKKFHRFADMIEMSHRRWNHEMSVMNYDQAWSMAHFFIHAKNGKYRKAFQKYIEDMAVGKKKSLPSFRKRFKMNITTLQKEYNQWWTELEGDPTEQLRNKIMLETLMAFLGRADMQNKNARRQIFETAEDFFTAAGDGKCDLDINDRKARAMWLPPSLLKRALTRVQKHPEWQWQIKKDRKGRPQLQMTTSDGTVYLCKYTPKLDKKGIKVGVDAKVEITKNRN